MRITLALSLTLCLLAIGDGVTFQKKSRRSSLSLLLSNNLWTNFFKSFKIIEKYSKEYQSHHRQAEKDRITIIRPQMINHPKTVELVGEISHTMDNPMKLNITVIFKQDRTEQNHTFKLNVGTTTSDCYDFEEPMGKTCFRSNDYRIYSDHGPKLVHQCVLAFWPKFMSGGRFCYKMYRTNKKISLNYNNIIVSAAGEDEQAVYLPVIERDDGQGNPKWKVLKFYENLQ